MLIPTNDGISVGELRRIFRYSRSTGILRWRIKHSRKTVVGGIAGCTAPSGYVLVGVNRTDYRAHRIAWAMVYGKWPDDELDHKNRIRNDNRISNLRLATRSLQAANLPRNPNNTSGYRGVSYVPTQNYNKTRRKKPWIALINFQGRRRGLGFYRTAKEAAAAYDREAKKLFGEFYRPTRCSA